MLRWLGLVAMCVTLACERAPAPGNVPSQPMAERDAGRVVERAPVDAGAAPLRVSLFTRTLGYRHTSIELAHAALMQRAERAESVARLRRRERLATATVRLSAGLRANADVHRNRIDRQRERVAALAERSERAARLLLRHRVTSLERCGQLLTALSHRGVPARGVPVC